MKIKKRFLGQDIPNIDQEILWFIDDLDQQSAHLGFSESVKQNRIDAFVTRRMSGEPLAYILGHHEFMGIRFHVTRDVLIPRRETEELVECIESEYRSRNEPVHFLDLGSGSGCIGLSLAVRNPMWTGDLVEVSPEAFAITKRNALALSLIDRVQVHLKSAEEHLANSSVEYDLIAANPPYIDRSDPEVDVAVRKFEPELALYAADHGLAKIKVWTKMSLGCLARNGRMYVEIGHQQAAALSTAFSSQGIEIKVFQDLQGRDRWIRLDRTRV